MKKLMMVLVMVVGVAGLAVAAEHGDTSGNLTYIDLTDDSVENGEWATNITSFAFLTPGSGTTFLRTNPGTVGVSYFDGTTTVAVSKKTAMITAYSGFGINSWMETASDGSQLNQLIGYIWGTPVGVSPDFAYLMEDTNEDDVYAYLGVDTSNLYPGLFGDRVFTASDGNFFIGGSTVALGAFFPPFALGPVVIVSDFAYGEAEEEPPAVPEPGALGLFGVALLVLRKRRR